MRFKIKPAKLSSAQKKYILYFVKNNALVWSGSLIIGAYDYSDIRDEIKEDIRAFLILEQNYYCAYCGLRIPETTPLIEHIADKSSDLNKQQMFNPFNLVLACLRCNLDRKKTRNSVEKRAKEYKKWKFKIIHPILDEPSEHIEFDSDFVEILKIKTEKGKLTYEWFDLDHPVMVEERLKDSKFKKDIISKELETLLLKIQNKTRFKNIL